MSRIAYVNGRYAPHCEAAVHVEDRGYQFSDGVYEVIMVRAGRMVDGNGHLERLGRSLEAVKIDWPMNRRSLEVVIGEVVRRNRLRDGFIYLQVTRGVVRRDHQFPDNIQPSLVMTARRCAVLADSLDDLGVGVITIPDTRWKRCDIKSISLLSNVLSKQEAREAGAYEAWLVDEEGYVTEGASSNAWIVTGAGGLVTRPVGRALLGGVTRQTVLELARGEGVALCERPFTVEEARVAAEAFLTSTTSFIKPVVSIDGVKVGAGRPGPVCASLTALYAAYVKAQGGGE